jgi:hypothetical protein
MFGVCVKCVCPDEINSAGACVSGPWQEASKVERNPDFVGLGAFSRHLLWSVCFLFESDTWPLDLEPSE